MRFQKRQNITLIKTKKIYVVEKMFMGTRKVTIVERYDQ